MEKDPDMNDYALLTRIEQYIANALNEDEIDELWADLIDKPEYLKHLETLVNLKNMPPPRKP